MNVDVCSSLSTNISANVFKIKHLLWHYSHRCKSTWVLSGLDGISLTLETMCAAAFREMCAFPTSEITQVAALSSF